MTALTFADLFAHLSGDNAAQPSHLGLGRGKVRQRALGPRGLGSETSPQLLHLLRKPLG